MAFAEYVEAEASDASRVAPIKQWMNDPLKQWSLRPVVLTLRTVDPAGAITRLAELSDLRRFDSPTPLMLYLGRVPTQHSSGNATRHAELTKTGNGHVRRILIEWAWSYRHPARMTLHLKRKAADAPQEAQHIA